MNAGDLGAMTGKKLDRLERLDADYREAKRTKGEGSYAELARLSAALLRHRAALFAAARKGVRR